MNQGTVTNQGITHPAAHSATSGPPSLWVQRHARLFKPGARVLDVACGSGRHLRWLAAQGYQVTGVDRDGAALASLDSIGSVVTADIEDGPWPFAGQHFDGVVVTNYLWRPLLPVLRLALAPGGVLIYETFAHGHQTIGRPSRPDFLLQPGELLRAFAGLRVVAYEDGYETEQAPGGPRFVQRLAAANTPADAAPPARHVLAP